MIMVSTLNKCSEIMPISDECISVTLNIGKLKSFLKWQGDQSFLSTQGPRYWPIVLMV